MREISPTKYIAILSVTILVFFVGITLGQYIAEKRVESLTKFQEEVWMNLFGTEFQSRLLGGDMCRLEMSDIYQFTQEKITMGKELSYLENTLGKTNPTVLKEKERYLLISLNQFLILDRWVKECNKSMSIILFFYSNTNNATISADQGFILDYVYSKNSETVVVYAFDVDIKNPALDTLRNIYKIKTVPSLVINGVLYEGFQGTDKIVSLINGKKI